MSEYEMKLSFLAVVLLVTLDLLQKLDLLISILFLRVLLWT